MTRYEHLGDFSDWADYLGTLGGPVPPAAEVRERVGRLLDVPRDERAPDDVRVERRWTDDGLVGEELSWSVGFGPRTHAWLLHPADRSGPLPGVVALHGHDGFKYFGKEKIADGPEPPDHEVTALRGHIGRIGRRRAERDQPLQRRGLASRAPGREVLCRPRYDVRRRREPRTGWAAVYPETRIDGEWTSGLGLVDPFRLTSRLARRDSTMEWCESGTLPPVLSASASDHGPPAG